MHVLVVITMGMKDHCILALHLFTPPRIHGIGAFTKNETAFGRDLVVLRLNASMAFKHKVVIFLNFDLRICWIHGKIDMLNLNNHNAVVLGLDEKGFVFLQFCPERGT